MRFAAVGLLGSILLFGSGCQNQPPNPTVRSFVDVHGDPVDPLICEPGEVAALIFITTDCPIANGYAPQLKEMFARFEGKPVKFYLVHVDPVLTVERARKHAADYGYKNSVILDPTHELVELCQVRVTPEAVVYSSDGELQYRGRINNWYGDIGRKRFKVSKHELRDAIDAVLAGKPVAVPRADAVGCEIEAIGN